VGFLLQSLTQLSAKKQGLNHAYVLFALAYTNSCKTRNFDKKKDAFKHPSEYKQIYEILELLKTILPST
jgi:hypothetical protein